MSGAIGQQEDQLFDKVNDAKVFKKSIEETFGNIFSVDIFNMKCFNKFFKEKFFKHVNIWRNL